MSYADTYRAEASDLLADLERALLELEERPDDHEIISRVFRDLHTIKGSGSMFGFDDIAAFTHDVESVYDSVREGRLRVTARLISLTLLARDHISALLNGASLDVVKEAGDQIISDLREYRDPVIATAETYRICFKPGKNVFLRVINLASLFREVNALGSCSISCRTELLPDLQDFEIDKCHLFWDLVITTTASRETISEIFQFVDEDLAIETGPFPERPPARSETALQGDNPTPERIDRTIEVADNERPTMAEKKPAAATLRAAKTESSSLRVSAEKLDDLVNVVGEIVTMQARLSQLASVCADPEVAFVAEELERLTDKLRDNTMSMRMLPIGATFGNYKRLLRDLSRQLGKQVELVTEGAETELDKTVIDKINDPLVHLIRNCVDHGIESPEQRRQAGKPEAGTIRLSAAHSGAHVIVQVKDDGAGLNKAAIRRQAVTNGLIRAEQELTEQEVFALILQPGFSTAATISGISGRGVGMDVVKQNVESLSGTLEISSRPGQGTTFTLKLPLTLAIIDGLLVQVADQHFVMPLSNILECFELSAKDVGARCFVEVRGEMLPYIDIREYFGLAGPRPAISQAMIADTREGKFGFLVDNVVGDHKTVIKRLGGLYKNVESISGATILGDGTVALILDLHKLAQGAIVEQTNRLAALISEPGSRAVLNQ